MAASNDVHIWAVIGASGQGKGLWVKQKLREIKPARLVAWDFMDEYGDFAKPVATLEGIRQAMLKAGTGPLSVRYVPKGAGEKALRREFEALCSLVYAWGHCVFIAEELANVTTPGWAPAAWRKMTTSGRHAAVHIIGMTQTPALVDKTFLANASMVHVCALREQPHRIYVARKIDCDLQEIVDLQRFEYIERDYGAANELRKGKVKVPGGAPTPRGRRASATGSASALQQGGGTDGIGVSEPSNQPRGKPK